MNYYKTERDPTYLFTVKSELAGEIFFKAINHAAVSLALNRLHRFGRCRDRKSIGVGRQYGHVKLEHADRWDLYLKSSVLDYYRATFSKAVQLLNNVAELIRSNAGIIEYANPLYKDVLNNILTAGTSFHSEGTPLKKFVITEHGEKVIKEIMKEVKGRIYQMSNWDVTLKARITINGSTEKDLERHLTSLGFTPDDLQSCEKIVIDEHTDLPLVEFSYGDQVREVRVISKDDTYLTGYEENQYKKFRVDRIIGSVNLIEMPTPKDDGGN